METVCTLSNNMSNSREVTLARLNERTVLLTEFNEPADDTRLQLDALRKVHEATRRDLKKIVIAREETQDQLSKVKSLLVNAIRDREAAISERKRALAQQSGALVVSSTPAVTSEEFDLVQRAAVSANRERDELAWRCADAERQLANLKTTVATDEATRAFLIQERDELAQKLNATAAMLTTMRNQFQLDHTRMTSELQTLKSRCATLEAQSAAAETQSAMAIENCRNAEELRLRSEARVIDLSEKLKTTHEKAVQNEGAQNAHYLEIERMRAEMKDQAHRMAARMNTATKALEAALKDREELQDQRWSLEIQLGDAVTNLQTAEAARSEAIKDRDSALSSLTALREHVKELESQLAQMEEARVRTLKRAVTAIMQRKVMEATLATQNGIAS